MSNVDVDLPSTAVVVQMTEGSVNVPVIGSSPGGTGGGFDGEHNDLDGRSTADAHPITAITGLEDALDEVAGGASALADLTDVDVETDPPAPDDVLAWDGTENKWTPATLDGGVALSNATPADLGTAAPGVSTEASRADHVHDLPTAADVGAAASLHVHSGSDITSGTVATARLGSGTADATTFLRGDQTWAAAGSPRPALPRTSGAWYTLGGITNNAATSTPNAAGMLVAHPVWLPAGSYDRVGVVTSAAGTATWRLGLYPSDPTAVTPDGLAPVASLGTIDMSATPGVLTATITLTVPTAGLYWAAVLVDAHTSAPTVYGWDGNSARAVFLPWDGYLIGDGGVRGTWARFVYGIPTGAMPATYPVSISTDVRIPQVRFRAA